jgi:pimeloyl-ACP methyl ester carboxylesterase
MKNNKFKMNLTQSPALKILIFIFICIFSIDSSAQRRKAQPVVIQPLGTGMENYDYPFPVHYFPFIVEGNNVRMAYMDVSPRKDPNGKVVILMHGKNFFGAYWEETIKALINAGFRVIVPDQIGFGKSSKPIMDYSFHMLAENTRRLLDSLQIEKVAVVGHSMGGMLASRFALMYPERTTHLVLENPLGLEDYKFRIPYTPTDSIYERTLQLTEEQILNYHKTYYVQWKRDYEKYVQVHSRWLLSPEYPRLARISALTEQMIYMQPVVHEFPLLRPRTLMIIGKEDRTTIGRDRVSEEILETLGQFSVLSRRAAERIPDVLVVEIENVGHIPHFEAKDKWHRELITFLK